VTLNIALTFYLIDLLESTEPETPLDQIVEVLTDTAKTGTSSLDATVAAEVDLRRDFFSFASPRHTAIPQEP
jgi:hypothetical protein